MRHHNVPSSLVLIITLAVCFDVTDAKAGVKEFSPIDFGLLEATSGEERYNCLYRTHCAAVEAGVNVTYKGIDTLNIDIPQDAHSIPLTDYNDFEGLVLIVNNNTKKLFVFQMAQKAKEIQIDKSDISSGRYSHYPLLSKDKVVLVLKDKNPWVINRRGYNYGAERKDIICLKNGKPQNKVISGYDTFSSEPVVSYYISSPGTKIISNITFIRAPGNTSPALFINLLNQSDVIISNVRCDTPSSDLYGDTIFRLNDCANIEFKDIIINGTYSKPNKSGYGISMNNVYNVSFYRLMGYASWGIFGNNNVNNIRLKQCDINRFDVHCYGRDIYFEDCKFRNLYNQFSSMYGTVSFKKCEFFDSIPVLFESSYNAYTKFDLRFKNCVIHASKNKDYLISAGELTGARTKERSELAIQQFPDLFIDGLRIDMPDGVDTYYLYHFRNNIIFTPSVEGVRKVRRVRFNSKRNGVRIITVDTRNQKAIMSLGGIVIICGGLFSLNLYSRRNKKRK